MHQLGIALQNSVADNQAYPSATLRKVDGAGSLLIQADWIDQLEHGLGASKIITNFLPSVFHCPSDASTNFQDSLGLSYGYNRWGIRAGTNASFGLGGAFISRTSGIAKNFAPLPESQVVCPSEMMAIADDFGGAFFFGPRIYSDGLPIALGNEHFRFMFERHQGKLDVLFCDGHMESPTVGFFYTNTTDAALVRWNRDHLPYREQLH